MSAPRVDWTAGNTFSSAIDQWFQALWVLWIYQIDQSRVDPSTCFAGRLEVCHANWVCEIRVGALLAAKCIKRTSRGVTLVDRTTSE